MCGWHTSLYAGCTVPVPGYVGHFRGDPNVPELVGYEVGIGPVQPDGLPDRVGVPSGMVSHAVDQMIRQTAAGVAALDQTVPPGQRPTTVDQLTSIIGLIARVHGEWIRIHPFANGNGRTARVWAAWMATRYNLPTFVTLKPRPADTAYAAASRESMGRPPDFKGNHELAERVFASMLALALLP